MNGRLRMTARTGPWTWPDGELAADDVQPPAHMVATVINRASVVLPAAAGARLARLWGGLIAMTPDGLPVIERSPEIEGLVIAAGFSGHGFCLGPITGRIICDLVSQGETPLPIQPFRRARFEGMQWTARAELHG